MSELSREQRERLAPYWTGPVDDIYVLQGHRLAAMLDQARAEGLAEGAMSMMPVVNAARAEGAAAVVRDVEALGIHGLHEGGRVVVIALDALDAVLARHAPAQAPDGPVSELQP